MPTIGDRPLKRIRITTRTAEGLTALGLIASVARRTSVFRWLGLVLLAGALVAWAFVAWTLRRRSASHDEVPTPRAIDRKVRDEFLTNGEASYTTICVESAGRIVLIDAQAESLFGHGRAEMCGQQVEFLFPDRERSTHVRRIREVIDGV
jgi:hypothetical protein